MGVANPLRREKMKLIAYDIRHYNYGLRLSTTVKDKTNLYIPKETHSKAKECTAYEKVYWNKMVASCLEKYTKDEVLNSSGLDLDCLELWNIHCMTSEEISLEEFIEAKKRNSFFGKIKKFFRKGKQSK